MTDKEYITEITGAFKDWAARCAGDLSDKDAHASQWRTRFREFGYGLGDLLARGETTGAAIRSTTGSAYSTLYVVNAFNRRPGIVLDAKDIVGEIAAQRLLNPGYRVRDRTECRFQLDSSVGRYDQARCGGGCNRRPRQHQYRREATGHALQTRSRRTKFLRDSV